ncbi:hypothetical protein BJ166DRAFT_496724 [Pestalotiopsis sp. NC0098]|nr:hypothetical protein BJ166DRAFT_496724 [Pestalotiopsis sp. NC0098]
MGCCFSRYDEDWDPEGPNVYRLSSYDTGDSAATSGFSPSTFADPYQHSRSEQLPTLGSIHQQGTADIIKLKQEHLPLVLYSEESQKLRSVQFITPQSILREILAPKQGFQPLTFSFLVTDNQSKYVETPPREERAETRTRDQEKFETPWAPDPSFPDVKRQPSVSKQPENDQDFRDDEDFQDKNSNDPFHTGDLRAALPTQPGVEEGGVQNLDEKPAHHHKPTSRRSDTRYGNDTVPRSVDSETGT